MSTTYNHSPRARTLALWVVLLAFFMDLLDSTIVNVAIPSIQSALHTSYASVQWIIAGYALAFALCLVTGGRLGDIFGYKPVFLCGVAGFTAASLLCGLAESSAQLVGARLVQGVMAALMVPQILALVQVLYKPDERAGISGVYGALAGVATVSGPILGALLITADVGGSGWRAIFLVNVPVGVATLVLGARYLPNAKAPHPMRLDLFGAGLLLCAMSMLMVPLIQGRDLGWPAWCVACMLGSCLPFAAFGMSQRRRAERDGSPLVAPVLFRTRSFVAGISVAGVFFGVVAGFFLTLVLFLQLGLHYGVLKAGLTGIPFSLGVSSAAALTGAQLVPRFGRRVLSAGPLVMAGGFALLSATSRHFGAAVTPWQLSLALLISGIGMGCVVASIVAFTLVDVPLQEAGSASGIVNAVDQVGGAIGIAVLGGLFFTLGGAQFDFQAAFERTLLWQIGALLAVSAGTWYLPLRVLGPGPWPSPRAGYAEAAPPRAASIERVVDRS